MHIGNIKITKNRFNSRFVHIADIYGFRTTGPFHEFLLNCRGKAKLCTPMQCVTASVLLKELEDFIADYKANKE